MCEEDKATNGVLVEKVRLEVYISSRESQAKGIGTLGTS